MRRRRRRRRRGGGKKKRRRRGGEIVKEGKEETQGGEEEKKKKNEEKGEQENKKEEEEEEEEDDGEDDEEKGRSYLSSLLLLLLLQVVESRLTMLCQFTVEVIHLFLPSLIHLPGKLIFLVSLFLQQLLHLVFRDEALSTKTLLWEQCIKVLNRQEQLLPSSSSVLPAVSVGFTISFFFWWDFCICDRFFNPTIDVFTFHLRGWWCMLCVFLLLALIGLERWNACVHRLDLGLYLILTSFWGMESEPMLMPRETSPLPGHYGPSYSGPTATTKTASNIAAEQDEHN